MKSYELNLKYLLEDTLFRGFLQSVDILIIALCFLLTGFVLSTILNDEMTKPLKRSEGKGKVFGEIIAESLLTMVLIIVILFLVPKIPSIVPQPTENHRRLRVRASDILISFAILSCQTRFQDKIRFLLQDQNDKVIQEDEDIRGNYNTCITTKVSPGNGFECVP